MKKYSYLAGAAFLAIASSASFASITLQAVTETINSTLAANGWVGYDLLLVADGTQSTALSAIDFKNVVVQAGVSLPTSNIGISGNIHQEWIAIGSSRIATPDNGTIGYDGNDSFFFVQQGTQASGGTPGTVGYLGAGYDGVNTVKDPATEDNDKTNGTNPPYTRSPLTDTSGSDFGVGSTMTISLAYLDQNPTTGNTTSPDGFPSEVELAFIIVPSSVSTTINGVAVDQSQKDFAIETVLGGTTVPEPASVGLVGLAGLALLARRRRKV